MMAERSVVCKNLLRTITDLIEPSAIGIMTEPETKGLGLLIGELRRNPGTRYWTIRGEGVISTETAGVTIIVDVSKTVKKKILRRDNHLQLYVSTHWYTEWRNEAERVCLLGKGATATDFVCATVMFRNCNALGEYLAKTDFEQTIRDVRKRKSRMIALERERRSNAEETGIRETDGERRRRERAERRDRKLEDQRNSNENETGFRETDEERSDREREERRREREQRRLRERMLEMEKALELERDANERLTGIRETYQERRDRVVQEKESIRIGRLKQLVGSGLIGLEDMASMSDELSNDDELRKRIQQTRSCISNEQWWAANNALELARKRISLINSL
ncbi:MAG: hypothetical protein CMA79_02530 [Euryarchaeota archaeon]|nr:hypothetical protein [Euryarchaeota archaeon]